MFSRWIFRTLQNFQVILLLIATEIDSKIRKQQKSMYNKLWFYKESREVIGYEICTCFSSDLRCPNHSRRMFSLFLQRSTPFHLFCTDAWYQQQKRSTENGKRGSSRSVWSRRSYRAVLHIWIDTGRMKPVGDSTAFSEPALPRSTGDVKGKSIRINRNGDLNGSDLQRLWEALYHHEERSSILLQKP